MFKQIATTLALATIGLPAAAQCVGDSYLDRLTEAQQADLTATIADMPYAEGLVWTASQGDDTLTIVGTMHIYDPRLDAIANRVADAVETADLLLVEATDEDELALQRLIAEEPDRLFITDGPTLPDLLDEETWAMLSDAATDRGVPGFMAAQMQPWYLSLLLAIPTCAMADLTAGAPGLDKMLMDLATSVNVPVASVEPYTTLFDIFGTEPVSEQVDMLRVNLMAPELQQEMFVAMLDRYFAEDVGRLWEMSRLAVGDIPDLDPDVGAAMFADMEAGLLNQRNRNWIPVILDAMDSHDDVVLAVGAAHLIGEEGVLQLLENEGWTLTRQTSP